MTLDDLLKFSAEPMPRDLTEAMLLEFIQSIWERPFCYCHKERQP